MKKAIVATVVGACALAFVAVPTLAVDTGISAKKIQLKDNGKKGKLNFLSKDSGIAGLSAEDLAAVQGSAGGAMLDVCAANGQRGTEVLPYANWKVNKKGVMKYKAKGKVEGVKVITLKPGKTLKIVAKSAIVPLDQAPGGVSVRLDLTGSDPMCTYFSAATAKKDEAGLFKAKGATAPSDCSNATLLCGSPSGAFLDL